MHLHEVAKQQAQPQLPTYNFQLKIPRRGLWRSNFLINPPVYLRPKTALSQPWRFLQLLQGRAPHTDQVMQGIRLFRAASRRL